MKPGTTPSKGAFLRPERVTHRALPLSALPLARYKEPVKDTLLKMRSEIARLIDSF